MSKEETFRQVTLRMVNFLSQIVHLWSLIYPIFYNYGSGSTKLLIADLT